MHKCHVCGLLHDELPSYGSDRPASFWDVPEQNREKDIFITSDSCVIADKFFFIRGCIEIPISDWKTPLVIGAWISIKGKNFMEWQEGYYRDKRSHLGPYFGWLNSAIPCYHDTLNLKTNAIIMDNGIRPRILIEENSHQLSIDQRKGIILSHAWELVHKMEEYNK